MTDGERRSEGRTLPGGKENSFRESFFILKTLTMMQLKEKIDLSYVGNFRKTLFKIIYFLLEFAAVTAVCFLLFYFAKLFGVFSLVNDVPVSVVTVVFTFMFLLSVGSSTISLVKALYFSRDNLVLLTFPARPSLIFLSKIAVFYLYELRKNVLFLIPFFFAYGISKGISFFYYPWVLFLFLFVSLLPVLISALLSIPALFVTILLRKVKPLQYALSLAGAGILVFAVLKLIAKIPENIDLVATWGTTYWKIQDFLNGFTKVCAPFHALTQLIVGRTVGLTQKLFSLRTLVYFAALAGIIVVAVAACLLLSGPLFYKMASKPFEYTKKLHPEKLANKQRGAFRSAVRKEIAIGFRDNSLLSLFAVTVIVQPVAVILLNKLYSAMNTRYLGTQMTVGFNVLVMLLISLSANISMASVYSRDGSAGYLNKVQPTDYAPLLLAKLVGNLAVTGLGTAVTVIAYSRFTSFGGVNVLVFVTLSALAVFHIFESAEMDIMNPQTEIYATFSEQSNNPNENKSALLAFVIAAIAAVAVIFLSMEGPLGAWIKLAIFSVALAAVKILSFALKTKVFYKERS